ncbi:pheromone A receptor-domain-containing protein [Cyathus striatus]|nr:pheromone A receptor-domain-containing protein [Cyathus striatus]
MAASNHVFSAFSFIAFILVCIPFPWHLQAWNTGTCLYMAWTAIACLVLFINSIIWDGNTFNHSPVWCDITSKIIIGISVAIPAASLCINRRLYHIASVRSTIRKTAAEKRRAVFVDLTIGIGIPVLEMALHYIVQGHRFDIVEDVGCFPTTYDTPPAYVIVWATPVVIGLVSGTYSVLSILEFQRSRSIFKDIISTNSGLNARRYFKLMALAGSEILFCVPLGITTICLQARKGEIQPWISWEDTHFDFSAVREIPALLWRSDEAGRVSFEMTRWLVVGSALLFFMLFGFAEEAVKHYQLGINAIRKHMGYTMKNRIANVSSSFGNLGLFKSRGESSAAGVVHNNPSLPVYVSHEVFEKRDSIDSHLTLKGDSCASGKGNGSPFSTLVKPTLVVDMPERENVFMENKLRNEAGRGYIREWLLSGCHPHVSPHQRAHLPQPRSWTFL